MLIHVVWKCLVGGVAGVVVVALATAQEPSSPVSDPPQASASASMELNLRGEVPVKRMREGSQVRNLVGRFKPVGDRVAFTPSDAEFKEMLVLENLALERIARVVSEDKQREWSVSGEVTEFRGGNYLLVERAVLKAAGGR